MTKSTLWTIAKYLLAIGVLAYVLYASWEPASGNGLKDVWDRHVRDGQPIAANYLLLALCLHFTSLMSMILRWYILVRAQDLPFTFLRALRLGTLGFLCSAFMPGAVGGDVVKAAALAREERRRTVAVATVVMDRALSLWGLILLVAVVGSACWALGMLDGAPLAASRAVIVTCSVIVLISVGVWFSMGFYSHERSELSAEKLTRVPKVGNTLAQLWQVAWLYRYRPASVAWAVALSTVSNVCEVLAFFGYAHTFWDGAVAGALPGVADHFLLVPVGLVISALPLFPGGAGIGEAGFGGLYELFGAPAASGVLGSLLFRVSGWALGILGYLFCLIIDTTPVQPETEIAPAPAAPVV